MVEVPLKILIIRFSSFGDVLQTLSVVAAVHKRWPQSQIHWVTRSEFTPLIENHPHLSQVWGLSKHQGFSGLWHLSEEIHQQSFDCVYDAHSNLRSHFVCFYLYWRAFLSNKIRPPQILRRSIKRWKRFLLFRFRINQFEQPFSGQRDLLEPLKKWGIPTLLPQTPQLFLSKDVFQQLNNKNLLIPTPFITLAPSAAFALKRWPLYHWKALLELWLAADSSIKFVLLGGPEDTFLEELRQINPQRIYNVAGKLTLSESAALIQHSDLLIANDTGLLHAGEQLGHPTIALMGPAPFGFPSRTDSTKIMELPLNCRPCSKHGQGPCRNTQYQWCLVGITPKMVFEAAQQQWNHFKTERPSLHE